jgi:hypothetical protein
MRCRGRMKSSKSGKLTTSAVAYFLAIRQP